MRMYTIGELATVSGIPSTTLRYYDSEGILQPEIRNSANGYRYYSEKQLLQAEMIKELKGLGIKIQDIRLILQKENNEYMIHALELRMREMQKESMRLSNQLVAIDYALQRLQNTNKLQKEKTRESEQSKQSDPARNAERNTELKAYQVELYTMPEMWVLATRYISYIAVDNVFTDRVLELQNLREQYELFSKGPAVGIFHDGYSAQFTNEYGDLELCLPIVMGTDAAIEHSEIKHLDSCLCAATIHIGHYKFAYRAYLNLLEWIENSEYRITGPAMEIYEVDPRFCTNINEYLTRICFPIELKE